jgi:Ca2+-binding EF-hand superfamily protein
MASFTQQQRYSSRSSNKSSYCVLFIRHATSDETQAPSPIAVYAGMDVQEFCRLVEAVVGVKIAGFRAAHGAYVPPSVLCTVPFLFENGTLEAIPVRASDVTAYEPASNTSSSSMSAATRLPGPPRRDSLDEILVPPPPRYGSASVSASSVAAAQAGLAGGDSYTPASYKESAGTLRTLFHVRVGRDESQSLIELPVRQSDLGRLVHVSTIGRSVSLVKMCEAMLLGSGHKSTVSMVQVDEALRALIPQSKLSNTERLMLSGSIRIVFELFDEFNNGHVDVRDMISGLAVLCDGSPLEKMSVSFAIFDRDQSGYLGRGDLFRFFRAFLVTTLGLSSLPSQATPEELSQWITTTATAAVRSVFEYADTARKNKIAFGEFTVFVASYPSLLPWFRVLDVLDELSPSSKSNGNSGSSQQRSPAAYRSTSPSSAYTPLQTQETKRTYPAKRATASDQVNVSASAPAADGDGDDVAVSDDDKQLAVVRMDSQPFDIRLTQSDILTVLRAARHSGLLDMEFLDLLKRFAAATETSDQLSKSQFHKVVASIINFDQIPENLRHPLLSHFVHLFAVHDETGQGRVDSVEFSMGMAVLCRENRAQLFVLMFHLFDLQRNDALAFPQLTRMFACIIRSCLVWCGTSSQSLGHTKNSTLQAFVSSAANESAMQFLKLAAGNNAEQVTLQEFLHAMVSHRPSLQWLNMYDTILSTADAFKKVMAQAASNSNDADDSKSGVASAKQQQQQQQQPSLTQPRSPPPPTDEDADASDVRSLPLTTTRALPINNADLLSLVFLADRIGKIAIADLLALCTAVAEQDTGRISHVGFTQLMVELSNRCEIVPDQVRIFRHLIVSMFVVFDHEQQEAVDAMEFFQGLLLLADAPPTKKLEIAFLILDTDKDGFIDQQQLERLLASFLRVVFALNSSARSQEPEMTTNTVREVSAEQASDLFAAATASGYIENGKISRDGLVHVYANNPDVVMWLTILQLLQRGANSGSSAAARGTETTTDTIPEEEEEHDEANEQGGDAEVEHSSESKGVAATSASLDLAVQGSAISLRPAESAEAQAIKANEQQAEAEQEEVIVAHHANDMSLAIRGSAIAVKPGPVSDSKASDEDDGQDQEEVFAEHRELDDDLSVDGSAMEIRPADTPDAKAVRAREEKEEQEQDEVIVEHHDDDIGLSIHGSAIDLRVANDDESQATQGSDAECDEEVIVEHYGSDGDATDKDADEVSEEDEAEDEDDGHDDEEAGETA